MLDHINKNHDKIITSTQVEMEYKKNRQKVIVTSLSEMKGPKWDSYKLPVILSEAQAAQSIEADRENGRIVITAHYAADGDDQTLARLVNDLLEDGIVSER